MNSNWMLHIYSTAPLTRGENAVVGTGGGNKSQQFVKNRQKKPPFLLLFWVWDIYFSYSFLVLRRHWKSRMQTFGEGPAFLVHPSFMPLWSLPASESEGALTRIHSTVVGNFVAFFWLLLSTSRVLLLVVNICCTFAPQKCGRFQHLRSL